MSQQFEKVKNQRLFGQVVRVDKLELHERRRMFEILDRYYDHVSWESFEKDLGNKSECILLRGRSDLCIYGFSTLKFFEASVDGSSVRAVFSGDTIVERQYWGQPALQRTFLLRLLKEKIRRPFSPLHWFLITKGFKTYLLMANNFIRYYPSPDGSLELMEHTHVFAQTLFGPYFSKETGLIDLGEFAPRLKSEVAPIRSAVELSHPKIAYFESLNKEWARGVELACVANLEWRVVARFVFKSCLKLQSRFLRNFGFESRKSCGRAQQPIG